jgi:S1-C subfamily serine protease
METKLSETGSALLALSNDLATAVEKAGHAVVAVNARPRTPSSGVHWRQGVVVTADHTVKRHQEITVTLSNGNTVPATLAGRDPGTDLAVLKLESADVPVAEVSNTSSLRVGNVVLAVGRGGNSGLSASLGVISALSGAWRTWRGGQIDQLVR